MGLGQGPRFGKPLKIASSASFIHSIARSSYLLITLQVHLNQTVQRSFRTTERPKEVLS